MSSLISLNTIESQNNVKYVKSLDITTITNSIFLHFLDKK